MTAPSVRVPAPQYPRRRSQAVDCALFGRRQPTAAAGGLQTPRRLLAIAVFACILAFALILARMEPNGLTVLVAPALIVWDVVGFLLWFGHEARLERAKHGGPPARP